MNTGKNGIAPNPKTLNIYSHMSEYICILYLCLLFVHICFTFIMKYQKTKEEKANCLADGRVCLCGSYGGTKIELRLFHNWLNVPSSTCSSALCFFYLIDVSPILVLI